MLSPACASPCDLQATCKTLPATHGRAPGTLSSLWACMQSGTSPLQLLLGLRAWAGSSIAFKIYAGPTLGMLKGRLDQAIGCFCTHLKKAGLFPLLSPLLPPPSLAKLHAFIAIGHKYEFGLTNFLTWRSTRSTGKFTPWRCCI